MTMQADQLLGAAVTDSDGQPVGTVDGIFRDDVDGTPKWARVRSGKAARFVPLAGGRMTKTGLSVPFDHQKIVSEPDVNVDRHMSVAQENELRRHFGLAETTRSAQPPAGQAPAGHAATAPGQVPGQAQAAPTPTGPSGTGTAAPTGNGQPGRSEAGGGTRDGADWITRAEEKVTVSTETAESGRARMHKYVDSEPVEQTVRVFHEEYEIERVPIKPEDRIEGSIAEDEREIILHEERAVITKETVPVERVRLSARRVAEEKTIRGEIRKERIEVDTSPSAPAGRPGNSGSYLTVPGSYLADNSGQLPGRPQATPGRDVPPAEDAVPGCSPPGRIATATGRPAGHASLDDFQNMVVCQ